MFGWSVHSHVNLFDNWSFPRHARQVVLFESATTVATYHSKVVGKASSLDTTIVATYSSVNSSLLLDVLLLGSIRKRHIKQTS
jgi:hypothetical protein